MRAVGLAVVLGAFGASCFDGADALGLPCLTDQDCGQGQRCEQGVCGGPPATATSDASTSTSSDPSSSSSSGSTTDESTGPPAGCGNGLVEAELGEDCDPGSAADEPTCDADCSMVECGDGHLNLMSGEECDDGNGAMLDDCTPECRTTLFWDDMEDDPADTMRWLPPEIPEYEDPDGMVFQLDDGWQWNVPTEPGTWTSGPYSDSSGTARLITRVIDFPPDPGPGFRYELRLRHRLRFDGNPQDLGPCDAQTTDGGVVWIMEGDVLRPAGPPPDYPDAIEDSFCAADMTGPDNPLYDAMTPRPAYSSITMPAFIDTGFPLPPDVAGSSVRLVFEIGYDCRNCWTTAPLGAGWTIDEVVVAPFQPPG